MGFFNNILSGNVSKLELMLIVIGFAMVGRSVISMINRYRKRRRRGVFSGKRRIGGAYESGVLRLTNGDIYEGDFSHAKFDGLGVYCYSEKSRRVTCEAEQCADLSRLTPLLPRRVTARIDSLQPRWASLMKKWHEEVPSTSCAYAGQFKYGKKCGVGVERYADGSMYVGFFSNDERDGEGCLMYNGTPQLQFGVYIGEFKAARKHGRGRFVFGTEKAEFEGTFVDGRRDGAGVHKILNDQGEVIERRKEVWRKGARVSE